MRSAILSHAVKIAQGGSDVTGFGRFDNSTSNRVLDLLEMSYLRLGEVVIERVTLVKFEMNNRGGDGWKLSWNRGKGGCI